MNIPKDLIISISGLRGLNPGSLTNEIAAGFATAFSRIMKPGPIIVSRDSRPSGLELKKAVINALLNEGREVLDADLIPLPTTQVAIEKFKAAGAIDITASHNPVEYNGLKFLGPDSIFIRQNTLDKLIQEVNTLTLNDNILDQTIKDINEISITAHIEKLKPYFLQGKKITVAVDATNGSGSYIIPKLLKDMGCNVVDIATDPNKPFPHIPEPTPKNLEWTQNQLKNKTFDLCVVTDPDADRLVLIDENNTLLSEETIIPLVTQELILQGRQGSVVINMSTSRMTEDVVKSPNQVIRSKVGEVNVVDSMQNNQAFFGGEGNGGVIDPKIHFGRDSLVGIVYIVNLLRRSNKTLSQLVSNLPHYAMKKEKVNYDKTKSLEDIYSKLEDTFTDAKSNKLDGLRLDWSTKWLHIRPSNTEPIIRIIAEAPTEKEIDELIVKSRQVIESI